MKKITLFVIMLLTSNTGITFCMEKAKKTESDSSMYHPIQPEPSETEYKKANIALKYLNIHLTRIHFGNSNQHVMYKASQRYLELFFKKYFGTKINSEIPPALSLSSSSRSSSSETESCSSISSDFSDSSEALRQAQKERLAKTDEETQKNNHESDNTVGELLDEFTLKYLFQVNTSDQCPSPSLSTSSTNSKPGSDDDSDGSGSLQILDGKYF